MVLLYIDPGTGSMLFSVLLGIFTAVVFSSRKLFIRLKSFVLGGKIERINKDKIPVIIFSDSKRYWNTFGPICEELDRRGIKAEYWTESEDDPGLDRSFENINCRYIGSLNKAVTKLNIMNSYVCLSTTPGLDVYQWKKSKNTNNYVHIFHSVSSGITYRMFGLDFYDAIMLPGDHVEENIREIEHKRNLPPKEMVKVGLPYLDSIKDQIRQRQFETAEGVTVLLAPTWGVNSLFNQLGDDLIDALISTGYNIIIRPHPQSYTSEKELIDRLKRKYPESEHLQWNMDNDNINVLGRSDIMISDYSGVIYDFSLAFDKPVIYSLPEFNTDPYDAWFIEQTPRMVSVLPEMAFELTKNDLGRIKEIIDSALTDEKKASVRARMRDELWYNHGDSAVKCVDYIENQLADFMNRDETNTDVFSDGRKAG